MNEQEYNEKSYFPPNEPNDGKNQHINHLRGNDVTLFLTYHVKY